VAISLQLILLFFAAAGAVAALKLKKPWKQIWLSICLFLAVSAAILIVVTSEKPVTRDEIARELAGADNFCFFEPQIIDLKNFTNPVIIKLTNGGSRLIPKLQFFISPYWIRGDAKNHPNEYYSIMPSSVTVDCNVAASFINIFMFDGSVRPLSLRPGRYRIEFATTLGTGWVEILTIEQSYDDLVAVVDVFILGRKPYHSPRPPSYVDW
jgi:hypothetical protein